MAVDWLNATVAERKGLHCVTSTILKTRGLSWHEFFLDELNLHVAATYHQGNFAKGTIARDRALRIHSWIVANHLDLAIRLDPVLFNPSLKSDWQQFLDTHGRYGDVQVVRPKQGRGIVERADKNPVADKPIPRGELFCFLIRNAVPGWFWGWKSTRAAGFRCRLAMTM